MIWLIAIYVLFVFLTGGLNFAHSRLRLKRGGVVTVQDIIIIVLTTLIPVINIVFFFTFLVEFGDEIIVFKGKGWGE